MGTHWVPISKSSDYLTRVVRVLTFCQGAHWGTHWALVPTGTFFGSEDILTSATDTMGMRMNQRQEGGGPIHNCTFNTIK